MEPVRNVYGVPVARANGTVPDADEMVRRRGLGPNGQEGKHHGTGTDYFGHCVICLFSFVSIKFLYP